MTLEKKSMHNKSPHRETNSPTLSKLFVSPAWNKAEFRISSGCLQRDSHAGRDTAFKSKAQGCRDTAFSSGVSPAGYFLLWPNQCAALLFHTLKELLNDGVSAGSHCPTLPLGSPSVGVIMIGRAEEFKWNRNTVILFFFFCMCVVFILVSRLNLSLKALNWLKCLFLWENTAHVFYFMLLLRAVI